MSCWRIHVVMRMMSWKSAFMITNVPSWGDDQPKHYLVTQRYVKGLRFYNFSIRAVFLSVVEV